MNAYLLLLVLVIATSIAGWVVRLRMRRRIERALGGKPPATEVELTSLSTWMRVGEAEALHHVTFALRPNPAHTAERTRNDMDGAGGLLANGAAVSTRYKFGWKPEEPQEYEYPNIWEKYEYPNIWAKQKTTGPERLVIAPSSDHVSLMMQLSASMPEPFWILYVLTVRRTHAEAGRYQSPEPLDRESVQSFLTRFKPFLENDGRHHLWVGSARSSDLLVYDNHNVIYAYGQLSLFESISKKHGMKKVDAVRFPAPHFHYYNSEYDEEERELLHSLKWIYFPLCEDDDYKDESSVTFLWPAP